jgi:putative ABC transport system permease protein
MILQSIKIAWKAIGSNKMRSFLTMLGIIIGVFALVVLVSLVTSATRSVTEEIEGMGTDLLQVMVFDDKGHPFRLDDLQTLAEEESTISNIAPSVTVYGLARNGKRMTDITMIGTTNDFFKIQGLDLASGRYLMAPDLDNVSNVAVLSDDTAAALFGNAANAKGKTMSCNGISFTVIGLLSEDNSMMGMTNYHPVYIPFTSALRLHNENSSNGTLGGVDTFYVSTVDKESMDAAEAAIRELCLERFDGDSDAFEVFNQNLIAEAMSNVTNIFAILLGGIAAISLLVGGIGIMNIMLVSVTERTREIGIRKAIGAKQGSVLAQFLIEALVLCLIGCVIGILLSTGLIAIINIAVEQMTFRISGGVIVIAVLFSTAIGLIFGLYPARKAAKKNPIDALRFE